MAYPILAPNSTWYKSSNSRSTITEVRIVDVYDGSAADETWNADKDNSGSIKCYRVGTILTIAGNGSGKIAMNTDSSYLFSYTTSSQYFINLINIYGAELLDASAVTTFYWAFSYCEKLEYIAVGSWNTGNVTSMQSMFTACTKLQSLDINAWDVSSVTTMRAMFNCCCSLTELDLTGWDVSHVTTFRNFLAGHEMYGAMSITSIKGIEYWDMTSAESIQGFFQLCDRLTSIDVSKWDLRNCTDMSYAFNACFALQRVDVSHWDTSKVTTFNYIFNECYSLQSIDISNWNTSSAKSMKRLFPVEVRSLKRVVVGEKFSFKGDGTIINDVAVLPTPPGGTWYTMDGTGYTPESVPSNVAAAYIAYPILAPNSSWYKSEQKRSTITEIHIADIFDGTYDESWNADAGDSGAIQCFRKGTLITMTGHGSGKIAMNADSLRVFSDSSDMFTSLTTLSGLALLDASNVTTLVRAFDRCTKVTALDVDGWDVSKVETLERTFQGCISLSSLDLSRWNVSSCKSMRSMFLSDSTSIGEMVITSIGDVSDWQTSKVEDMAYMFQDCSALETVECSEWNVSAVKSMEGMFLWCTSLETLDLSKWDVSNVTTMRSMFYQCGSIKSIGDTSNWNTSACTNMATMFYQCYPLQTLNVKNWNVSNVTTLRSMFSSANYGDPYMQLKELDVSNWDTSSCTDMAGVFYGCKRLKNLDISNWDVSKVETFDHFMAHSSIKLAGDGVARWVTSSAKSMDAMLYSCQNEVLDVSNFDTSNVLTFNQMFESCTKLKRIIGLENFVTSASLDFSEMFWNCVSLEELNLSAFDTRNATVGADRYGRSNEKTTKMVRFFDDEINSLKKVILGKNFSFNGDGLTDTNNAILPTPSGSMWYNASGESFAPSDVPDGINATYFSVRDDIDRDVLVKYGTLTHVADAIRDKCDISSEISVSEYATEIMSIGSKSIPCVDYNLDTDGNVVGVVAHNFEYIPMYMFYNMSSLIDADVSKSPNLRSIGKYAFQNCKGLIFAKFPTVEELRSYAFSTCSSMVALELGNVKNIESSVFGSTNLLSAVILKSSDEVSSNVLSKLPTSMRTEGGTAYAEQGYIYVPQSLIADYQSNNAGCRFRAIEGYPEISIYRWKRFTPANSYVFDGWGTYEAYYSARETSTVSVYRDFEVNTSGEVVGVGSYSSMEMADIAYIVNNGGNLYYRYSSTDARKIVRVEDMGSSEYYRYRMYYVSGNVKSEKDWSNLGSETTVVSSDPEYYPDRGNNGTYYFEKDGEIKIDVRRGN